MPFLEFLKRAHLAQYKRELELPEHLVALDPGETTGYAYFHNGELAEYSQLPTHRVRKSIPILQKFIKDTTDLVVYEDYKVYGWKTESHAWESLHTPKLIGAIEAVCYITNTPTFTQMAQQAKQFVTDQKLKDWGYYYEGLRHTRDAIRHGCYYMLFNHHKDPKGN